MEGLMAFIQDRRNSVVVVGGLVALALLGICLIGFYALTADQAARTGERASAVVGTEAAATSLPTRAPSDTPGPTDTPAPTATPTPTPTPTPTRTPTPEPTATPVPTDTPAPTDTPVPSPTPTPDPTATTEPSPMPERVEARAVEVVDGDTIRVEIAGEVYPLRYIGIDAPERGEWMGPEASQVNADLVGGKTVTLERDVSETDQYDRLLRYVFLADGTFVNAQLVRLGYARAIEYPPDVTHQGLLLEMEAEARKNGRGIWGGEPTATAVPGTAIPVSPTTPPGGQGAVIVDPTCCQFNSPGNDNYNKEEEYVCFANTGDGDADMSGWTVRDAHGWTYAFPTFVLPAGGRVRVATGCGVNRSDLVFWCKDETAVWNNDGDTVFLYDSNGVLVATYSY
jgi:micrococcal nuclease